MSESIVQLNNVSLNYDHRSILIDANFKLEQQEFVYLIGPTGVGKSSFLKLLYRDVVAQSGEVVVNGYQLKKLKLKAKLEVLNQRLKLLKISQLFTK